MRQFGTVYPQFWTGKTGKQLRKYPDAQRIALYLITCHHAHMSGIYYIPKQTMTYEIGITKKNLDAALKVLADKEFAVYDEDTEHIWVREMLAWQVKNLKPQDNRVKGVTIWVGSLPVIAFLPLFYSRYGSFLPDLKPLASPLQAPTKGVQEAPSKGLIHGSDSFSDSSFPEGGAGETDEPVNPKAKSAYGDHGNVLLTLPEYSDLVKRFGEMGASNRIRDADLYFGSRGNAGKYKSHYLTILAWSRKEQRDAGRPTKGEEISNKNTEATKRVIDRYMAKDNGRGVPDA